MSSNEPRQTSDSGFRQIIDTVAQQRRQTSQEKPAMVFSSPASAFRYFGRLMSGS
jgi:hypothetical protein